MMKYSLCSPFRAHTYYEKFISSDYWKKQTVRVFHRPSVYSIYLPLETRSEVLEVRSFSPFPLSYQLDKALSTRLVSERQIHIMFLIFSHFAGHKVKPVERVDNPIQITRI